MRGLKRKRIEAPIDRWGLPKTEELVSSSNEFMPKLAPHSLVYSSSSRAAAGKAPPERSSAASTAVLPHLVCAQAASRGPFIGEWNDRNR